MLFAHLKSAGFPHLYFRIHHCGRYLKAKHDGGICKVSSFVGDAISVVCTPSMTDALPVLDRCCDQSNTHTQPASVVPCCCVCNCS